MLCGDHEVRIIDPTESEGGEIKEVWKWNGADPSVNLPEGYYHIMRNLDECKLVDRNRKMLVTSSGGGMMLIDIKTKDIICYAHVPMAHSADLLPGNRIAVALSTDKAGNAVEIYDIDNTDRPVYRDSLYSGHGMVWNKERQSLYALGYSELREYKLMDWDSRAPSLNLVSAWAIPVRSGHDLSPVDEERMLLSGHEGVWWFDLSSGEFTPFEPLKDTHGVKSVNYDSRTGRFTYTKAEISWWTHNIYQCNPDKVLTIDSLRVYKVRHVK